jgi:thiamine biosynthesis lipoprotein
MDKRFSAFLAVFVIIAAVVFGLRSVYVPKVYTAKATYVEVMGTFASITAVAEDQQIANNCVAAAIEKLHGVDAMMSDYIEDSQLSKVNRLAFSETVVVDAELFGVLKAGIKYSKMSDGAFDITVGPVVDLWRDAAKQEKKPTAEQIEAANAKVGYEKLLLDEANLSVKFAVEGMRVDLGGIAKGYGIDKAVEAIRAGGAIGAIVDVGGDVACFGVTPKNKTQWRIGLDDPKKEGGLLLVLKLTSQGVATSGDYRRFVTIDGEQHSHIYNPEKGQSAKEFSSVSVIAASAMEADALATAVSVMGKEKGLALIKKIDGVEAMVISSGNDEEWGYTEGIKGIVDTSQGVSGSGGASWMTSPKDKK